VVTDHLTSPFTVVHYVRRVTPGMSRTPAGFAPELMGVNDQQPAGHGPPRVTQNEITTGSCPAAPASGWVTVGAGERRGHGNLRG